MNFMLQTRSRRFALYALTIVVGMVVSCVILAVIGYNSNQKLPSGPAITDRMEQLDKIRLQEAFHLKAELGDAIWPGYAALEAPVIIWNQDYEFLFGVSAPPSDWEQVPDDDFEGDIYFRRPADDPQNFAVPVGEQWAASVFTKYRLDASLISAIRELMPPVILDIFPYRIFIQPSELQIAGVQHEYFHVVQAVFAPEKFAEAEAIYQYDDRYWALDGDMQPAWREEIDLLIKAAEISSDSDAAELARQFLAQRDQRRQDFSLDADLIAYEMSIEWLEGTAKYVELRSWLVAGSDRTYLPLAAMGNDPDFENYEDFDGQWNQAIRQSRHQAKESGDVRFYYTGMLQAFLLDRLMPDWKARGMEDGVTLEGLLQEAVTQ
jgi:hypothetical protein